MKCIALVLQVFPRIAVLFLVGWLATACSVPEGTEVELYSGSRIVVQDATIMRIIGDGELSEVAQLTVSVLQLGDGQSLEDTANEIFVAYLGTFAEVSGLNDAWLYIDTLPSIGPIRVSSGAIHKYERRNFGPWRNLTTDEVLEIKPPPGPKHPSTAIELPSGHVIQMESLRVEMVSGVLSMVLDYHYDGSIDDPEEIYALSLEVWSHYLRQQADAAYVDRALIFAFDRPKYGTLTFRGHLFIYTNRKPDGTWWDFPPTLEEIL